MKKTLFLIAAAVAIIFVSCSNDDVVNNERTYPVAFSVSHFSSQVEPLKATAWPANNYCQYVVYKEDGSVLLSKTINAETLEEQSLKISFDLPKGNYHLAVLSAAKTAYDNYIFAPDNYNTDYCNGNAWIAKGYDNYNIYFESINFSVNEQAVETPVVLNPMWSEIDIEVLDADVCILPAETKYVQAAVYPYYYGFSIKEKKATRSMNPVVSGGAPILFKSVADFRADKGYFNYIVANSSNVTVKLLYLTASAGVSEMIVGEKTIHTGDIAGGKHITFKGSLGTNTANGSFSISLNGIENGGTIPY